MLFYKIRIDVDATNSFVLVFLVLISIFDFTNGPLLKK